MRIRFLPWLALLFAVMLFCLILSRGTKTLAIAHSASDVTNNQKLQESPDAPTAAQNVELLGHIGGDMKAIFVANNLAYIGEGLGLTILDVTNPMSPSVLGRTDLLPGFVEDIVVAGEIVYVANGIGGLQIIDATNPADPTILGSFATSGFAINISVIGNIAYLGERAQNSTLHVIDVSNSAKPVQLDTMSIPGNTLDIFVANNTAYLISGYGGLHIIDVSNPANITKLSSLGLLGNAISLFVVDNTAYIVSGEDGLYMIDISNSAMPVQIGVLDTQDYALDIFVKASTAYVVDSSDGLHVFDVSNPSNLIELGFYDMPGQPMSVFVSDTIVYAVSSSLPSNYGQSGGLRIVNLSNPAIPTELGFYLTTGRTHSIFVAANKAYMTDGFNGLYIASISNPALPTTLGFYDTIPGYQLYDVAVVGHTAYAVGGLSAPPVASASYDGRMLLQIIDVSNPANPAQIGSYEKPDIEASNVFVVGNRIYLASDSGGMHIFDVSNAVNPIELGSDRGTALDIFVVNNIAYVASWTYGLRIMDVSNPTNLTELGRLDTPGSASSVSVNGNLAYVADSTGGLRIVDIFNSANPIELGFYQAPSPIINVYVVGNIAYAISPNRLDVINVSDPTNPIELGFYDTKISAHDVFVANDIIYLADGLGGLLILRYTGTVPPPTRPTITPAPTVVTPVATPLPTLTTIATPSPGCRMVNNIQVCASNFSGNTNNWTASGDVRIGNYTLVEQGSVVANAGVLTGNGRVSMATKLDGSQHTLLFADSFMLNSTTGELTPQAVAGRQFLLNDLAGFNVQQDLYQLSLNVLQGKVKGSVNLNIVIPGNNLFKAISFTLDHTGAVSGVLSDMDVNLGEVNLTIQQAALDSTGFAIKQAYLQLPPGLGGAKATLSVGDARISSDGKLTLADGSAQIDFPNIHVGGDNGFAIQGAKTTLSINNGQYFFDGKGTFILPGVGPDTNGCKVGTHFKLTSTPPPLREASLAIDGCFKIPIANTGFFLTGVSGMVALDEATVAVDLNISIEGGPTIPELGPAISGAPSAHWDNSWAVGLSGALKVFRWQVADGSLNLDARSGLVGSVHIQVLGVIEGNGRLHIWKAENRFHFTGHADVSVQVTSGAILNECKDVSSIEICIIVPPTSITAARGSSEMGEFNVAGSGSVYGLKGQVEILGYKPAYFVDVNGNIQFDLGGLQNYSLIAQAPLVATGRQAGEAAKYLVAVSETPVLLIAMGQDTKDLTLSLTDPTGRIITSATSDPTIFYANTITQTMYTIASPTPGTWTVTVGNHTGNEHYLLKAVGAPLAAMISQPPVLTANGNDYLITLQATGAPTATYSLFYDDNNTGNDGKPITAGLPLSQTGAAWDTRAVPQGSYYVYALLDDPFNAPIITYSTVPVTIIDNILPDPPTGLRADGMGNIANISWDPSNMPDVMGYRLYYREPDGGATFVADIPNRQQTTYTLLGLYLEGSWEIAASAYDVNNNESTHTAIVLFSTRPTNIYLPLVSNKK